MAPSRKYENNLIKLLRKPSLELETKTAALAIDPMGALNSQWNDEVKRIQR
jgi:hypothetical protein